MKAPKLMPYDKRQMLIDAIELSYKTGTARSYLVGHPLSWYDYKALWNLIVKLNQENIEQGGDDMFEFCNSSYQNCFSK